MLSVLLIYLLARKASGFVYLLITEKFLTLCGEMDYGINLLQQASQVNFSKKKKSKSCVVMNGEISECFASETGERQRKNLSPLSIALYVNDLENHLLGESCTHSKFDDKCLDLYLKILVLMYADDTVIMGDSEEGINNALNALDNYSYCHQWKLEFNCSKTKVHLCLEGKGFRQKDVKLFIDVKE